jgi:SAM-dependent methyltransferase
MEHLDLAADSFDLVYSSLALHYVENLIGLMSQIYSSLVPGGALSILGRASDIHGAVTAGLVARCGGRKIWPVDGYLNEGPRSTDWLAKGVIKQHRTPRDLHQHDDSSGVRGHPCRGMGPD